MAYTLGTKKYSFWEMQKKFLSLKSLIFFLSSFATKMLIAHFWKKEKENIKQTVSILAISDWILTTLYLPSRKPQTINVKMTNLSSQADHPFLQFVAPILELTVRLSSNTILIESHCL